MLRQQVTLAAHNPSDNHGRGELGGESGVRMLLPLGHGCEVTARRLQLMLNPKNERPGHLECEAKDLATWDDLWLLWWAWMATSTACHFTSCVKMNGSMLISITRLTGNCLKLGILKTTCDLHLLLFIYTSLNNCSQISAAPCRKLHPCAQGMMYLIIWIIASIITTFLPWKTFHQTEMILPSDHFQLLHLWPW